MARNVTHDLLIWKKLFPAWTGASVIYLGSKWQRDADGEVRGVYLLDTLQEAREQYCCTHRAFYAARALTL